MSPDFIAVGDAVADSPVGAGVVTDITDAGYRTDGVTFDPCRKAPSHPKEGA
jgi:hypothetical protein